MPTIATFSLLHAYTERTCIESKAVSFILQLYSSLEASSAYQKVLVESCAIPKVAAIPAGKISDFNGEKNLNVKLL